MKPPCTGKECDEQVFVTVASFCLRRRPISTFRTAPDTPTGPNVLLTTDTVNDCFPCGMDVSIGRNLYDSGTSASRILLPTAIIKSTKLQLTGPHPSLSGFNLAVLNNRSAMRVQFLHRSLTGFDRSLASAIWHSSSANGSSSRNSSMTYPNCLDIG